MKYYVFVAGAVAGPFDSDFIRNHQDFHSALQICQQGSANWKKAGEMPEFSRPFPAVASNQPEQECPFCAELIPIVSRECPYCRSALSKENVQAFLEEVDAIAGKGANENTMPSDPAPGEGSKAHSGKSRRSIVTSVSIYISGLSHLTDESELVSAIAQAAARHGGRSAGRTKGSISAVWGREDFRDEDVIRAIVAAQMIAQRIKTAVLSFENQPEFAIGVSTGPILETGDSIRGDALDRSNRISASARSGEICVCEATWSRLGGRFSGEAEDLEVKGEGLLRAYILKHDSELGNRVTQKVMRQFAGRDSERQAIMTGIKAFLSGSGGESGTLVVGHGGTGKSRLCSHAAAHFSEGCRILFGQGVPTDTPTLGGIVVGWLVDLIGGADSEAIELFLANRPELESYRDDLCVLLLRSERDGSGVIGAQRRLDRNLASFFVQSAGKAPLLLAAADLQWADNFSIDFCISIAELLDMGATGIYLLLDARPGVEAGRLSSAPGLNIVEIGALSSDEIRRVVETVIEGDISGKWLDNLEKRTGGLLLNICQVLDAIAEAGDIEYQEPSGRWRLTRSEKELPVPRSLADLIWGRIEKLPEEQREILLSASVCGRRFPRALLSAAIGKPPDAFEPALQKLIESAYLLATQSLIAFEHGSILATARQMLLDAERRKIARRIVDSEGEKIFAAESRQMAEAIFRDADWQNRYLSFLSTEAHRLIRAWRHEEAKAAIAAVERALGTEDASTNRTQFMMMTARARMAEAVSDWKSAFEQNQLALEIAKRLDDRKGGAIVLGSMGRVAEKLGEMDKALEFGKQALDLDWAEANPRGQAMTLTSLGRIAEKKHDWNGAMKFYQKAISLGDWARTDPRGQAIILGGIGRIAEKQGDWEQAMRCFEEALSLVEGAQDDPRAREINLASIGRLAMKSKNWDKALHYTTHAADIARFISDDQGYSMRLVDISKIAGEVADFTMSRLFVERAIALDRDRGNNRGMEFGKRMLARLPVGTPDQVGTERAARLRDIFASLDRPVTAEVLERRPFVAHAVEKRYWASIGTQVAGPFTIDEIHGIRDINGDTLLMEHGTTVWKSCAMILGGKE